MDHTKVTEFLGRFVLDLGATGAAGSVVIGHRLGLYRALGEGPATPEQFAARTGCHPRYLTEWLRGQAVEVWRRSWPLRDRRYPRRATARAGSCPRVGRR